MAEKARHAYGSQANLTAAIESGIVDSYDILLLSGEGENNAMGWITKDGVPIIIDPAAEVAKLEAQVDTKLESKASTAEVQAVEAKVDAKADAQEVEEKLSAKADAQEVEEKLSAKADATAVESQIEQAVQSANAYADEKVETTVKAEVETAVKSEVQSAVKAEIEATVEKTKYEITDAPDGTLVDYREKEIRIMCPADAVWTKQAVGAGGDASSYYVTFKVYAPDDSIVGYVEHLGTHVDNEVLKDFSVDTNGRRYQPTWLAVAKCDESTGVWTYYGASSTEGKYIGWDYQIDWYNENGVMVQSDCVRINLSNENCHFSIEPYYVGKIMTEVDTKIETVVDEKIKEIDSSYEIVEF